MQLELWQEIIATVMGVMFYILICGFFFFAVVLFTVQLIYTKRMKRDFINSLDDHDKSVVMQYINTEYDVFSRFKKNNKK